MKTIALCFLAGMTLIGPVVFAQVNMPGAPQNLPGGTTAHAPQQRQVDPAEQYLRSQLEKNRQAGGAPGFASQNLPHQAGFGASGGYYPNSPDAPKFSIDFPGGTPGALIDFLKEAIGTTPNIMVAQSLEDVRLPAFKLQEVTLEDLFLALNGIASENIGARWQLSGSREPIWVLNPTPPSGFDANIDPLTGQPTALARRREVRVVPIGNFLSEYTVDDITTSIQTAWAMMPEESKAQLKFHKDTNLLIAVGTRTQLDLLNQVLGALSTELETKRSAQARSEKAALPTIDSAPKAR
jgi:hypothetical protein